MPKLFSVTYFLKKKLISTHSLYIRLLKTTNFKLPDFQMEFWIPHWRYSNPAELNAEKQEATLNKLNIWWDIFVFEKWERRSVIWALSYGTVNHLRQADKVKRREERQWQRSFKNNGLKKEKLWYSQFLNQHVEFAYEQRPNTETKSPESFKTDQSGSFTAFYPGGFLPGWCRVWVKGRGLEREETPL